MDILNALVAILNFVVIPAAAYGAQLALGALGVTVEGEQDVVCSYLV